MQGSAQTNGSAITATIGFGGGCHWCTEAIFQSLKGVKVVQFEEDVKSH